MGIHNLQKDTGLHIDERKCSISSISSSISVNEPNEGKRKEVCVHKKSRVSVHFNKEIEVIELEAFPTEYHGDLYWSIKDKKEMKKDAEYNTNEALFLFQKQIESMELFYDFCHIGNCVRDPSNVMLQWSQSKYRGLETWCSEKQYVENQCAVKSLLAYYSLIYDCELDNADELLRNRSLRLSRRSRVFALKRAEADAQVLVTNS